MLNIYWHINHLGLTFIKLFDIKPIVMNNNE